METQIRKLHNAEIIVGTPGRIIDHLKRGTLLLDKVKILVLDECDRMFDMGFRNDVEFIVHNCPIKRQTMLFSATISQDLDYFIKKYTINAISVSVNSYVESSKLKQIYYDVQDHLKFSLLVHLLKKKNSKSAMVFCNTRRNADFVANNLNNSGINAIAIHGGLEQKKRIKIIEDFHKNKINILICTDIAARGLDIKGVSHIYNYDLPKDSNDYIHRVGRTARAGEEGEAINLLASRDYENFRKITENESLSIKSEKSPFVEQIRINIDYNRKKFGRREFSDRRGNNPERNDGSGIKRRNNQERRGGSEVKRRNNFGKRRNNSFKSRETRNNYKRRSY